MHYYKRNIGDYAKKAGRLSMLQHGAYTLLIDACYDRERFPTRSEAIDWTWASTPDEVAAVEFVLSKFFTLDGDTYTQNRIREDVDAYHETSENNRRIATEREAKRRESSTERARSVHGAPPNHKPLTTNQEPVTKNQTTPDGVEAPKRPTRKCPESFAITDDLKTWAIEHFPGVDLSQQTGAFRDHTFKTAISDWAGAWRNWIRKADGFAPKPRLSMASAKTNQGNQGNQGNHGGHDAVEPA